MANLAETLASIRSQHQSNQEQQFFTGLMQYGINSGGQFDIENDTPIYTGGAELPPKTVLWNQFVTMKGGRLSAMDVQNFEAQYAQAKAMKSQKQMEELQKLRLRGFSDKKIEKAIESSPQLYNNLIDMVSDLQGSGTPEGLQQAEALRTYLPDMTPSKVEKLMDEGIGVKGILGGALGIGATTAAVNFLRGASPDAVKEARTKYKSDVSNIKAQRELNKKNIASTNKQLNKERMKLVKEQNKDVVRRSDMKISQHKNKIDELRTKAENLKNKTFSPGRDVRYKAPKSRIRQYLDKGSGTVKNIAGFAGLSLLPELGEYLGDEEGREVGRAVSDVGLLGMAGRQLIQGPLWSKVAGATLLGAEPLLRRGHDFFYGDEE